MKTSLFFWLSLTLFTVNLSYSQTRITTEFGKPSEEDFAMEFYDKDPSAPVVILYEQGHYGYEVFQLELTLVKTIYKKIKVFDATDFDRNVENIVLTSSGEGLNSMSGFIHRGGIRHPL